MPEHTPRLIGRDAERRVLDDARAAARRGRGGAVLVVGEPGIGKSALLESIATEAEGQDRFVLRARGIRGGTEIAFGALHELLHPILPFAATLPDRQAAALDVAFGRSEGPAPDRLLLGVAILGLLEEASTQGPVTAFADDLHWMDRTSADALAFVASRLRSLPVLVIAATRAGTSRGNQSDAFSDVLHIGPLGDVDADRLLADVATHLLPRDRSRIRRESYGNPLALVEFAAPVARAADGIRSERMSTRLERTFLEEVRLLPLAAQRALLVVVAGEDATIREVSEALEELGLAAADLEVAERQGILRREGERYVPRHPLVGSAHYDAADPVLRREVHRALAKVVRAPDRRALHRAEAAPGLDEAVAAELDAVAEAALHRGAPAEAASAWRRAADLSPTPTQQADRLVEAAEAARRAGASGEASVLLGRARPLAELSGARTQQRFARAEWMLSMTADHRGRTAEELVVFAVARTDPSERAEALLWAAAKCYIHQEPAAVRELVASAVEHAPEDGGRPDDAELADVALALVRPGWRLDERTVDRFLARARATDGVIINCLAFAAEESGDMTTSDRCWTAGARLFHDAFRTSDETTALCGRASPRITAGHLADGLADADRSERLSHELDLPVVAGMALAESARAHARRGDRVAAVARLDRLAAVEVASGFARIVATAAWAAALIATEEGRHEDALAHYGRTLVNRPVALWAGADIVEAAIRTGDTGPVVEWLDDADTVAVSTGSPHLTLLVERTRGLLASDDETAIAHLGAAVVAGSPTHTPFDLAVARTHLGERLRRVRRIIDAREHLTEAVRLFDAIGASSWATRARAELRATGGVAGHREGGGGDPAGLLTAQELLVSRMASTGRTNKEIADEIYLSHRTVAAHLSRAFTKLGISRRSQLAAALPSADQLR